MPAMDSLHSHIAGLHIQDRIAEATAARQAREVKRSRKPRLARFRRASKPRPRVAVDRSV